MSRSEFRTGQFTAEQLRTKAASSRQRSQESFDRCDTDGFLSQWALDMGARLYEAQAKIEENDGKSEFDALLDLEGKEVPFRWVSGPYGESRLILDSNGRSTGIFIKPLSFKAGPRAIANLRAKGFVEGLVTRPAIAIITCGSKKNTGLSGCANAYVDVVEADENGYRKYD